MTTCLICGIETTNSNFCSRHKKELIPGSGNEIRRARTSERLISRRLNLNRHYFKNMPRKKLIRLLEEALEVTRLTDDSIKDGIRGGKFTMLSHSRSRKK